MEDIKAAKKIIKRAKKHPDWYTAEDVRFAKMVKKRIKAEQKSQKETKSAQLSKRNLERLNNPISYRKALELARLGTASQPART